MMMMRPSSEPIRVLLVDDDAERSPLLRIERRDLELLGVHFAEAFEPADLRLHVLRQIREHFVALALVERQ